MTSFIKAMRSDEASFLDSTPNANHLLNVIARRARRTKCTLNNLDIGECFISHKSVGLTEQQYRTAKKQLVKWGFANVRVARRVTGGVTSGVTVAKLLDSRVYDINISDVNATTTEEQRHDNGKATSNKNDKNDKNEDICQQVADEYNSKLPELGRVKVLSEQRKAWIRASIKQFKNTEHEFDKLETWSRLFDYISDSDFLMGRLPTSDWTANFDFIIKKSSLLKIVEGQYVNK